MPVIEVCGGNAVNLKYNESYQKFREEVRDFLTQNWTPEDVAANPVVNSGPYS